MVEEGEYVAMKIRNKAFAALCLALIACLAVQVALPTGLGVVTVARAASRIKLNKTEAALYSTRTMRLTVLNTDRKVTWSTSDKKVATVSSKGKVTAVRAGSATITAKVGRTKLTCKLTVKPAVALKKSKLAVDVGGSGKVSVTYALKGKLTAKSSDTAVAACKVKAKGSGWQLVVTGVKAGKATVTLGDSLSKDKARLTVTVNAVEPKRLELYDYIGKSFDDFKAAIGVTLSKVSDGRYSNGTLAVNASTKVWSMGLTLNASSDAFEMCGVHSGMTRAEAEKALSAFGFKLETDWGPEDGAEFYGFAPDGRECMFSYGYSGDSVTDVSLYGYEDDSWD